MVLLKYFHHYQKNQYTYLVSDAGKEYVNSTFSNFLEKHGIKYFSAKNGDTKACVAERFVRSLKELIFKYLTLRNTYRYIDVLDDLLYIYNHRFPSSIGMSPSEVNENNILDVWNNLMTLRKIKRRNKSPKFKIGAFVRMSKPNKIFAKGYLPNFSDEIFKIKDVVKHKPTIVYKLIDLLDEDVDGTFYEEELKEVIKDDRSLYRVNKLLDTRNRNGVHEVLVEWKGWPSKFNSWISHRDITSNSY